MSSMHSSQERKVCEQNSDLFLGLSSIGIAEFHRKDKKEGRKTRDWKIAVFPERAPRVAPLLLPPSLPFCSFLPVITEVERGRRTNACSLPPSAAFSFLAQNAVGLNLWILARLPTKMELSPPARLPLYLPS